ncbi:MAG: hypothetical protein R2712_23905, partial [Vicinamibacterales bacterium]
MRRAAVAGPLLACLVTGAALYVTRGVLDATVRDGRAVRIALLPPWESLLGFVLLAGVALLLLHRLAARRAAPGARAPLWSLVQPALVAGVLLIPFLPFVADWWPVVQVLAGPMGALVWLVTGALLAWSWWHHGLLSAGWLQGRSVGQWTAAIAIATTLVSGA